MNVIDRRTFGAGLTAAALATLLADPPPAMAGRRTPVPLPSAHAMRHGIQEMVDCGPRLPGSPAHTRWLNILEDGFTKAGLTVLPCEEYAIDRWVPGHAGLDITTGPHQGPIRVATTIVRSAGTARGGITAPLVYGGALPIPSVRGVDIAADAAALAAYPAVVASWAAALSGTARARIAGSILLVDLPAPVPLTLGAFSAMTTYNQWAGHTDLDWATIDYKRLWLGPWLGLDTFQQLGARAVVFGVDSSFEALHGNFSPHTNPPQPLPGLVVDRDVARRLRTIAATPVKARLTLTAHTVPGVARSVTAVLPGADKHARRELVVVASHSDGQNAFEENGGVALLGMARHFASLPLRQRPRRTLVFTLFPGHMSGYRFIQDASCFIHDHADLTARAVGAVCVEHLGAQEWHDTIDRGYHATGLSEVHAMWTTQGPMFELVKAALQRSRLDRHVLLRPPYQITPGYPFHDAGVPHASGISGPDYLVRVSKNGDIDKLDAALAARQVGFYADIVRRLDTADKHALRTGDPTLGHPELSVSRALDGPATPMRPIASCAPVVHR